MNLTHPEIAQLDARANSAFCEDDLDELKIIRDECECEVFTLADMADEMDVTHNYSERDALYRWGSEYAYLLREINKDINVLEALVELEVDELALAA